jgi:hypothetical protein
MRLSERILRWRAQFSKADVRRQRMRFHWRLKCDPQRSDGRHWEYTAASRRTITWPVVASCRLLAYVSWRCPPERQSFPHNAPVEHEAVHRHLAL